MIKILVPAVAALGMVAFAAKTQAVASDEPASGAAASSVAAEPIMGWHLSYEGTVAKLAYGVENSDQLVMMITCAPRHGSAVIFGDVLPASPRLVQTSAGSDMDEARVPISDPALQSLARDGILPVVSATGPARIRATPNERRLVSGFLNYCDGARA
jgi:hypothetical protein